jgi:hypothetical protein
MLREFAEIVAEFGPFRGMHCATSAGQLCENGRTRYETGNHGRPQPQQGDMDTQPNAKKFLKGATGDWEVVIGMEVHAQVTSRSKLFSGASTEFGGAPNSHVSLVDAAMPGMLPVINEECVRQAIRTGLGLKARINLKSVFDRKTYFYPDPPQDKSAGNLVSGRVGA